MTVDAAQGTRRRAPKAAAAMAGAPEPSAASIAGPPPSLAPRTYASARPAYAPEPKIATAPSYAIGEIDQTVFDCPVCTRPLAVGARRCPGCRTRLINGVTLGKASAFAAAGLAIGLILGGGGGLLLGLSNGAAPAGPSGAPATSAAPAATAARSGAPTDSPSSTPGSAIPPAARASLVQLAGVNGRLGAARISLATARATKPFDASAAAQILRAASADTVYAEALAGGIAWPAAGSLGRDLAAAYGEIHDTAAETLDASVQNTAAYRAGASKVIDLLAGLSKLDAAMRATAASAGVDLRTPSAAPVP